ncbi:MAG: hypothetical protein ACI4QM_03650 [Alphaproteobacteria bacterium]
MRCFVPVLLEVFAPSAPLFFIHRPVHFLGVSAARDSTPPRAAVLFPTRALLIVLICSSAVREQIAKSARDKTSGREYVRADYDEKKRAKEAVLLIFIGLLPYLADAMCRH